MLAAPSPEPFLPNLFSRTLSPKPLPSSPFSQGSFPFEPPLKPCIKGLGLTAPCYRTLPAVHGLPPMVRHPRLGARKISFRMASACHKSLLAELENNNYLINKVFKKNSIQDLEFLSVFD